MPITLTQLNVDEALRYMGCPPEKADPATRALAEDCARELLPVLRPRWACRTFDMEPEAGGVRLSFHPARRKVNAADQKLPVDDPVIQLFRRLHQKIS